MEEPILWGFTLEELEDLGMRFLVPAFILYMIFIIGNLAWKSKAGKYGTMWLFIALGVGFIGFIAKGILEWWMTQ